MIDTKMIDLYEIVKGRYRTMSMFHTFMNSGFLAVRHKNIVNCDTTSPADGSVRHGSPRRQVYVFLSLRAQFSQVKYTSAIFNWNRGGKQILECTPKKRHDCQGLIFENCNSKINIYFLSEWFPYITFTRGYKYLCRIGFQTRDWYTDKYVPKCVCSVTRT